jgi:hypothetical protein
LLYFWNWLLILIISLTFYPLFGWLRFVSPYFHCLVCERR